MIFSPLKWWIVLTCTGMRRRKILGFFLACYGAKKNQQNCTNEGDILQDIATQTFLSFAGSS